MSVGGAGCCIQCDESYRDGFADDDVRSVVRPMIVCSKCGNKRCPKATDHRLACTGSNEPGQPGSAYRIGRHLRRVLESRERGVGT